MKTRLPITQLSIWAGACNKPRVHLLLLLPLTRVQKLSICNLVFVSRQDHEGKKGAVHRDTCSNSSTLGRPRDRKCCTEIFFLLFSLFRLSKEKGGRELMQRDVHQSIKETHKGPARCWADWGPSRRIFQRGDGLVDLLAQCGILLL